MLGGPISVSKKERYKYVNYAGNHFPSLTIGTFFRETGNNFIVGFTMPFIDSSSSKYFVQVETQENLQPGTIVKIESVSSSGDAYLCSIPDFSQQNAPQSLDGFAIIVYGVESKNPSFNLGLFTPSNFKRYLAVKISKSVEYYLLGTPIFIGSKGILMPNGNLTTFNPQNASNLYIRAINTPQTILFGTQPNNAIDVGDIIGFNEFYNAYIVKFV